MNLPFAWHIFIWVINEVPVLWGFVGGIAGFHSIRVLSSQQPKPKLSCYADIVQVQAQATQAALECFHARRLRLQTPNTMQGSYR